MPTPDASQYTQYRRYVADADDTLSVSGRKISFGGVNTFTHPPIGSANINTFLPSANKTKKFGSPEIIYNLDPPVWCSELGSGTNYTVEYGNCVGPGGSVFVCGQTVLQTLPSGTSTFDNPVGFIAEYSKSGAFIRALSVGSGMTEVNFYNVATDNHGYIYAVGYTNENLTAYRQYDGRNGVIAKFDSNFNLVWVHEFGSGWNGTYAYALTVGPNGYVYISVLTYDPDWNNPQPHSGYDQQVAFIYILDPIIGSIYNGYRLGDGSTGNVYADKIVWMPNTAVAPPGASHNFISVVGNASCLVLDNSYGEGVPGVDNPGGGGYYGFVYVFDEFVNILGPGAFCGIGSGNHRTNLYTATLIRYPCDLSFGVIVGGQTNEYLYSQDGHTAGTLLAGGGSQGLVTALYIGMGLFLETNGGLIGAEGNNTYIGGLGFDNNYSLTVAGSSNENINMNIGYAGNGTAAFTIQYSFYGSPTFRRVGTGNSQVWQSGFSVDSLGNTYMSGYTYEKLPNGPALPNYAEDGVLSQMFTQPSGFNSPIFLTVDTSVNADNGNGSAFFRVTFSGSLKVDWGDGQIETVTYSGNEQLVTHNYAGTTINRSITIDVSSGGTITYFRSSSGGLLTIDVTKCTTLTYIRVENNSLTSLDVSQCVALTYLRCNNNYLTFLDVSGLSHLDYLRYDGSSMYTVYFQGCGLSSTSTTTLQSAISALSDSNTVAIYLDPVQNSGFEGGASYFYGVSSWTFVVTPGLPSLGDNSYQFPTFGRGVAYGNGIFVAVGDSTYNSGGPYTNVLVSSDGGHSFKIPSGITGNLFPGGGQSLARSASYAYYGVWVVAGDDSTNGQTLVYSIDNGTNWSGCTGAMPGTRGTCVSFNNNPSSPVWVATGNANGDGYTIFRSTDGINWTGVDSQLGALGEGRAVAYGNGIWVVSGVDGYGHSVVLISEDGLTWSPATVPAALTNNGSNRQGLTYGNGPEGISQFVLDMGYNSAFVSPEGSSWTVAMDGAQDTSHLWTLPPFANDPTEWTFGSGVTFVDGNYMFSSGTDYKQPFFASDPTNGSTGPYGGWFVGQTGAYIRGYGNGVAQGGSSWVVVGSNTTGSGNSTDTIISSKNGIAWSSSEISPPAINNLVIASGGGAGQSTAVLTWDETNVTGRSISFTPSSPSVSNFNAGTVTLSHSSSDETYAVTITVTNGAGSASATINVTVGCFLGFVQVMTLEGPVAVEDIVVGTKILQPGGRYSTVVELKRTTITDRVSDGDGRLYADAEEKMVVTYWHKIRFSDETEETKAGEHPRLHQIFRPTPFDVFHIKLEDPVNDKVMIYDTNITAEGFIPVNPL